MHCVLLSSGRNWSLVFQDNYVDIVLYSRHCMVLRVKMCDSETFLENKQSEATHRKAHFVPVFLSLKCCKSLISLTTCIRWIRKTGRLCKNVSHCHRSTVDYLTSLHLNEQISR